MTRRGNLRQVLIGGLSLLVASQISAAPAHEIDLDLLLKSNDNAYKLPTAEQSGIATVLRMDYAFENKLSRRWELFADTKIEFEKYDSDASDADEDTFSLAFGAIHTKRFSKRHKLKSQLAPYYHRKDQTYISRSTGLVPVVGTEDLADRFDYDTTGIEAQFDYYYGKDWKLFLDIDLRDKDYTDDYGNLGLARFDYKERRIKPGMRYELDDRWKFTLSLPLKFREYTDRRAQDLLGVEIANSDLEYDYRGYEFEVAFAINSRAEAALSYEAVDREDNYAGALDYETKRFTFKLEFAPDDISALSLRYDSKDRDYASAVSSANPLELRSASGDTLEVEYSRLLMRDRIDDLSLTVSYQDLSREHSSPTFNYDQRIVQIGVSKDF